MGKRVVIISPSADMASSLEQILQDSGCSPETAHYYPTNSDLESLVTAEQPTAGVLIDFAGESQAMRVLWRLRRTHPELPLVVVNGPRKLSSVVQTKGAGAWGYVPESHTSSDIRNLAAQLSQEQQPHHPRPSDIRPPDESGPGKLISFIPAQGGNGASTIALHVGAAVAQQHVGHSLLVDFDVHTGTTAFQLGLPPGPTLLSALNSPELTEESLSRATVRKDNLDLLVGTSDTEDLAPETFRRVPELMTLLKKMYRYVFVDLPAPTYSSSIDVLTQSDSVCLVCTPEITSLYLAKRKALRFRSCGISLEKVSVLVNRATSCGAVDRSALERIVGLPVKWAIDNDYASVCEAVLEGGLVADSSVLSGQLMQLATEITNRLRPNPQLTSAPTPSTEAYV
jgi:pilus assembly protein CpaE